MPSNVSTLEPKTEDNILLLLDVKPVGENSFHLKGCPITKKKKKWLDRYYPKTKDE